MSNVRKVAAVTILFDSGLSVVDMVSTYLDQVDMSFVIDNSASPLARDTIDALRRAGIEYHHVGFGRGQAAALNYGIRLASAYGFGYVLTMDQDGSCAPGLVESLVRIVKRHSKIAVACPANERRGYSGSSFLAEEDVKFAMTSGSVLDVEVWEAVGGFDEKFSIDYVDHDYCLRLRQAGYRVIECAYVAQRHQTGTPRELRFLGLSKTISVHHPDRLFYMARNGFRLKARYGRQFPEVNNLVIRRTLAQFTKSLLLGPQRGARLASMLRGYVAYKHGTEEEL